MIMRKKQDKQTDVRVIATFVISRHFVAICGQISGDRLNIKKKKDHQEGLTE